MVRKLAQALLVCIVIGALAFFFYGMRLFPDSPIVECATGYCGKQGQSHTLEDYQAYRWWSAMLFWTHPLGMIALAILAGQAIGGQNAPDGHGPGDRTR
jgi:hypothetical protein